MTDTSQTSASDTSILAVISPSAPRRAMGIVLLCTLGGLLIYIALARPPANFLLQVFLLLLGGATLTLSEALRRATAGRLELTKEVLRDSSGRIVARIEQVKRVDRGTFANKPSNGFLLRLNDSPDGNHWAPGLWWRLGRRVGVGGITSAAETKALAEILQMIAIERHLAQTGEQSDDSAESS
ncbi:hypothetical protein CLV78_102443 [Aliiruegeria haliotis]|uniref:PH (Pleckstrin Homology) domain-containing protein n=1 Tax=Aliiruegeria haliotis TaxID=1280846 RepID=A0A2T0RVP0_9RHOB|nr:hypothetical protein [Aliiruegeria haliotis]PRY25266.1 hypothetical protein CLV78_102443 [Aliiruegeria haliotis]